MGARVATRLLTRTDVLRCLSPAECRRAVERAFLHLAAGRVPAPRSLGFESRGGGFHVKAALHDAERPRFVAKLNGNFPANPRERGLATIQGVLLLADASDGRPLAIMDSASVTGLRTAAASAVAATRLARRDASVLAIVGCGLQGAAHAEALIEAHPIGEIRFFDADPARAARLAQAFGGRDGLRVRAAGSVREAAEGAGLVATCTPGAAWVLGEPDVAAGAFVAAVGADYPHKREIEPALMRRARVVVDDRAQCAAGGDLHHAIAAGVMQAADVHADLAAVIAGTRPGRSAPGEIFVFDSTGIALEDAAAADAAYERALELGIGRMVELDA